MPGSGDQPGLEALRITIVVNPDALEQPKVAYSLRGKPDVGVPTDGMIFGQGEQHAC